LSTDVATPRSLPTVPAAIFAALLLLGVVVFFMGIASEDSVERTYRVFLHNWLMWAALAQGALAFSAAMRLTNATWPGPIRRVADSMGAFVPVSLLGLLVVYIGRHELFEWTHHPVAGKEFWFEPGFTFARDTIALIWVTFVSIVYLRITIRPMLGSARVTASGWRASLYRSWTKGWRGDEAEREFAERRGRKIAAVVAISFAICYSFLGIDMIMSLSPEWVSTMFPAFYSWGGFLSSVSLLTVICLVLRNSPDMPEGFLTPNRMHDLGKLIFAFSIFWMYLFWSQYFVIWYANIPEETGFIIARLGTQFIQDTWYLGGFWERLAEPYVQITLLAWILIWILPFWVLLGQRPKKTVGILGTIALGSVFGFWLERYVLVTPSLVKPAEVLAGAAAITPTGFIELGIGAGFAGAFFLCFLMFSRVFPGAVPTRAG
jgi:branched-subunit amino acid transport protein AzlD